MHDGVKRDNDLQRGQSLENNQHHLMIDGESSITAFELANRPTSVHRLGNINTLPYGVRFLPQNQDPTNGRPLPDNFMVPYPGYSTLTYYTDAGTHSYNGLLVSANRRLSKNLQLGVSYTWSKTIGYY